MTLKPDPIDVTIGANLRFQRTRRSVTLDALGKAIGVSYQQIQKYESGKTRISCGSLYRIAQVLDCSTEDLFPNLLAEKPRSTQGVLDPAFPRTRALTLPEAISRIPNDRVRRAFQRLTRALNEPGK